MLEHSVLGRRFLTLCHNVDINTIFKGCQFKSFFFEQTGNLLCDRIDDYGLDDLEEEDFDSQGWYIVSYSSWCPVNQPAIIYVDI